MQIGRDAPAATKAATYAVGDTVYSGDCRGAVVSMDGDTMEIIWSDGEGAITYPIDAEFLRKAFPWEN